ncbi:MULTISPECIES: hypothetical protein [Paraburkholderia]|uniref:hypothetical protein n=1 Tax=Paraburkholderia TaxID=1822464 RepID=UPI000375D0DA|nr:MULTISPECIES: hypothetical protein [Paraburkholderia]MDH6152643.1 hypothetical protein [Paraburkholderia sp. WSM4179]
MAKLKIILLYFILPILLFAAFVLYQVGAQHFGVAMMLVGAAAFIAWSWIRTTPKERAEAQRIDREVRYQQDQEWASYYASHQQDRHH